MTMGLEQQLRKGYRHARKQLRWKSLSKEDRVFVREYYQILSSRKSYSVRVAEAQEFLHQATFMLSPQTHAYVAGISAPLIDHLKKRKQPEHKKLARALRHRVDRLPSQTDKALRAAISRLRQKQSSLEARVKQLTAEVGQIPGLPQLLKDHASVQRRYGALLAKYHTLEHELSQKVSRATYNQVRTENDELSKRLRQRVSREAYGVLHEEVAGLRKKLRERVMRETYDALNGRYNKLIRQHRALKQERSVADAEAQTKAKYFLATVLARAAWECVCKKAYGPVETLSGFALKYADKDDKKLLAEIYNNRGFAYAKQGDRRAIADLVKSDQLAPSVETTKNLALARQKFKRHSKGSTPS
jgi:hypothetical protein